jgi:hypothetical protein
MKNLRLITMLVLLSWLYGCSEKATEKHTDEAAPPDTIANMKTSPAAPEILMDKMVRPLTAPLAIIPEMNEPLPEKPAYRYATKVQAPRTISKNLDPSIESSGQLLVWVGQPGYEPPTQVEMNAKSGILPSTRTEAISARIIPTVNNPLAFDIEPKQSECQRVEPEGTEVSFKLTPKLLGSFHVGASVLLYAEKSCSGDIVTRTAEPITVEVKVGLAPDSVYQEIWTAFMKFFKEILAILTALLVFFFRIKLKEIFVKGS